MNEDLNSVSVPCLFCDKTFYVPMAVVYKRLFCSNVCKVDWYKHKKNGINKVENHERAHRR